MRKLTYLSTTPPVSSLRPILELAAGTVVPVELFACSVGIFALVEAASSLSVADGLCDWPRVRISALYSRALKVNQVSALVL